jgi:hypothetical protein
MTNAHLGPERLKAAPKTLMTSSPFVEKYENLKE